MVYRFLSSYITMLALFLILALGAASATFIENDFGTPTARALVYDHGWYELILALSALNLAFVLHRTRLYRFLPRFLFHVAFIVILLGAGLTRYFGLEGSVHIREGESSATLRTTQPYLMIAPQGESPHFFPLEITRFQEPLAETISTAKGALTLTLKESILHKEGLNVSGYFDVELTLGEASQRARLTFGMGEPKPQTLTLGDLPLTLFYGARELPLPFSLSLQKFELERYPGSRSPAGYTSYLLLSDPERGIKEERQIFMNSTLTYRGYKFFQTSYDPDEKGTILTVNKDPGKTLTYLGYGVLFLGLILNLFDPKSRFSLLIRRLQAPSVLLLALLFACSPHLKAQEDYLTRYLDTHRAESKALAKGFGELVVQAKMGRMEPLNTLNREILYKLSGKSALHGMSADQILLGMASHPQLWRGVPLIKVKTPALQKELGIAPKNLARFNDFFDAAQGYKLRAEVERALALPPSKRTPYDNDLIKVDERLNITFMVFRGTLFKLFPLPDSPENRWLNLKESLLMLEGEEAESLHQATSKLLEASFSHRYETGLASLEVIRAYQQKYGSAVIPSSTRFSGELLFNRLDLFPRLIPAYILLGLVVLIAAFAEILKARFPAPRLLKLFRTLALLLFLIHTLGLALRWYVSAHAPFSDTYESIVYISWSGMLGALLFFRRSLFALAASILMAGVFLFSAHLSHIDPEITNLVPVLKSFWLTLHVSIITASYGFFGVSAFLGFFVLVLLILRPRLTHCLKAPLWRLTDINEVSLILGLTLLVIGNFLGGIWANESWGRYWAWDPKETWTYISILLYSALLHLRLLKVRHYTYLFALLSLWSFGSILMTYFGVNFYLAGLHSYAQGDPLPIPTWVYILSGALAILSLSAYPYRDIQTPHKGQS